MIIIDYYHWYKIQIESGSTINSFHFYIAFSNCLLILQPQLRIFKFIEFYLQEKYPIVPQICKKKKFISILLYSGLNNPIQIDFQQILKGLFIVQLCIIIVVWSVSAPFLLLAALLLFIIWGTIFCCKSLWEILSVLLRSIGRRFSLIVIKLIMILILSLTNQIIWTSVTQTSEDWYSTRIMVKHCDVYPTEYAFAFWKYLNLKSIIIVLSWIIL